jgi:hypothetical protein
MATVPSQPGGGEGVGRGGVAACNHRTSSTRHGVTVAQALSRIRNYRRVVGRGREGRVISRPLLIKGLEYDHALVLNAERLSATELYVALSRGRKSLTVVSKSRYLTPGTPQL